MLSASLLKKIYKSLPLGEWALRRVKWDKSHQFKFRLKTHLLFLALHIKSL